MASCRTGIPGTGLPSTLGTLGSGWVVSRPVLGLEPESGYWAPQGPFPDPPSYQSPHHRDKGSEKFLFRILGHSALLFLPFAPSSPGVCVCVCVLAVVVQTGQDPATI